MHTHLSLVNQKLAFARSLLSLIEHPSDGTTSRQKLLMQASGESVLLHLYSAYHFYLRELAENNAVKNPSSINDLNGLTDALAELDRRPSEIAELHDLLAHRDSWLTELLRAHARVFASPAKKTQQKVNSSDNLIATIELSSTEPEPSELRLEMLSEWLKQFGELVARQRETGAEY